MMQGELTSPKPLGDDFRQFLLTAYKNALEYIKTHFGHLRAF